MQYETIGPVEIKDSRGKVRLRVEYHLPIVENENVRCGREEQTRRLSDKFNDQFISDVLAAMPNIGHFVSYSEKEAAERLGVCRLTLSNIRKRGEISFVAVTDKLIRYRPQDLWDYAQKRAFKA